MSVDLGGVRRCAVLGSPIGHSLSPVLHRAAYDVLGLDWEYDAHEVTEAGLREFVEQLDGSYRGLSLTMPLKQAVLPLCTTVTDTATVVQSVNTVLRGPEGQLSGHNTDVPGCVAALADIGVTRVDSAVIVGSGATAASVLAAVAQLGAARVVVLARSPATADRLVDIGDGLGLDVMVRSLSHGAGSAEGAATGADVIVSTIPAAAQPALVEELVRMAPVVFDVVYYPQRTPLAVAAERAGLSVVPGFALLLHQAARQVELMTHCPEAPLAAMRQAGLAALAGRD